MRALFRLACFLLLVVGAPAIAQTSAPPQRPFAQLIDVWTRQLDRITFRAGQPDVLPTEIDALREQASDVRTFALAAANLARGELADTKKLLAPLETKPGPDQPPETDAVKAERNRLTDLATLSEDRIKRCEVVVARADQILERMTKLRSEVVLQTLLHRDASPLSKQVWAKLGPQLAAAVQGLSGSLAIWLRDGPRSLGSGGESLLSLAIWSLVTGALWWFGRWLHQRFGRAHTIKSGQRDRTVAAAIDGLNLVLVPILAVWLIGKFLMASQPPQPIDVLLPELVSHIIALLLVVGMTVTVLAPTKPTRRVLPLTDTSAHILSTALRRLMAVVIAVVFIYSALTQGNGRDAVVSVGALVVAIIGATLTLPTLANRAWQAARPEGSTLGRLIGGTWWSVSRLALSVAMLSSIVFALLGYATMAAHIHSALATSCLLLTVALLAHRFAADGLEAAAAPDTPTGRWARARLGLPDDAALRGHYIVLLVFDVLLLALLGIGIPAAWGADTDAILRGFGHLMQGVKVGGVTLSLNDMGVAVLAFGLCLLLARLLRGVVRDRILPTVDASIPLRQSIDTGLNYTGVTIAVLVGIAALGIDFTSLAIVVGALSVGIGLGLQNIANNVISGIFLLVERPIKAGDWVSVNEHEGFVRRINIRATEIETFQRTHVIVPNSLFLQNPVVNRTYADTSSRIEIAISVNVAADVTKVEEVMRGVALDHPRVLRVPAPIVSFAHIGTQGLDFKLFVFVAEIADRLVVRNDISRQLLARLIEEKIIDPRAEADVRRADIEILADALRAERRTDHAAAPPTN